MQVKDGYSDRLDIDRDRREAVMLATVLIAANMCLQGGEPVDVSRYVDPATSFLELKVTLEDATGTLVVYSPGYEEQRARFTDPESSALIPFAEPILCVAATGGPFEFNIEVIAGRICGLMPCEFAR
jgi:hypothetical protein